MDSTRTFDDPSRQVLNSRTHLASPIAAALLGLGALSTGLRAADLTTAALQHGARTADAAQAGIWKAVMPPAGSMRGEFDNYDPMGLVAGARIAADCSLNWVDPDFGRTYCFSSATSLTYFLDAPRSFLARAEQNWAALSRAR